VNVQWYCKKHGVHYPPCYVCETERLRRENEHLRAEIDRLKRGEWISVKERLPRSGDTVLVYYRRGDYRRMDIVRYVGSWVTVDWYTKVTHWMPLPEPPEKEDGKT